jgi:hypothetical protein
MLSMLVIGVIAAMAVGCSSSSQALFQAMELTKLLKDLQLGIQRVRMYPMDRADWMAATAVPELERDCP